MIDDELVRRDTAAMVCQVVDVLVIVANLIGWKNLLMSRPHASLPDDSQV
jgi:hypothetical protein